ncbi:AraC-like DNA-binding protein [Catenuloplanes nepalensis]|uniref:AraC-like DNA-binding protein n=1 Tax=Catenuloplanes nepalensis TaxID=587533 RepID=A0ABT9MSN4_9ACTN|nr:helix-turn-helix domain-containing protein [Catenuloplanes nepalensis]MDP9794441.1 AraC-like DNA-binding protein [Catenuloplanes nepalensis]
MPAILHPGAGERAFRFRAVDVAPALRPYVDHYWIVTWELREPYHQQVLPYPAVNMTFKPGRCRIAGVPKGRFHETLEGTGRVFGVRFRPGGFRPFFDAPIATITDRFVPISTVFPADLPSRVLAADDEAAAAILDEALTAAAPATPDPVVELAAAAVARTGAVARVDELAAEFSLGVRQLQRIFADYVGVSPKWVIRRHRLHEAAARAADGTPLDLGALAADLGYSDQAHLTRDFTAITGLPPATYIREQ